jgi:predicted helicase
LDKVNNLSDTLIKTNLIVRYYSNGISTNRDDWTYDYSIKFLKNKIFFFYNEYNKIVDEWKKQVLTEDVMRVTTVSIETMNIIREMELYN